MTLIRCLRRLPQRLFGARGFVRDSKGAVAVEFGILAIPFFAIMLAIMESAVVFMAGEVFDSAVNDANRLVMTGRAQAEGASMADYRQNICDHTFGMFDCSRIHIVVSTVTDFSSASPPPPVSATCTADDCDWSEDEQFAPGGGSNIVLVRAYYRWPVIVNIFGATLGNLPDNTRLFASVRVFRNEPFTWSSGGG